MFHIHKTFQCLSGDVYLDLICDMFLEVDVIELYVYIKWIQFEFDAFGHNIYIIFLEKKVRIASYISLNFTFTC
jgi:hypothetical protein